MSAAVLTRPTFTLADRLRIQQEHCTDKNYIMIGRLTTVVFEAQRSIAGLSQSRKRFLTPDQYKHTSDAMAPFSEKQTVLWASITLDWLTHKNAPILAVSRDRRDLLLPHGLTPLPAIPDPRWVPTNANEICPRIPQLLTGCPVVGDRVTDKISTRMGRAYGVLHPITELCVMLMGSGGTFGRITGHVDPADGTHLALLIDDSNPQQMSAYFVGGRFQFGS
ncbi:MAG TPA: hypothetical protein VJX23_02960 [Candidatus Binataceae bacterium]|nr:hypothetical protein [Candidatus Binataceae bacterium]